MGRSAGNCMAQRLIRGRSSNRDGVRSSRVGGEWRNANSRCGLRGRFLSDVFPGIAEVGGIAPRRFTARSRAELFWGERVARARRRCSGNFGRDGRTVEFDVSVASLQRDLRSFSRTIFPGEMGIAGFAFSSDLDQKTPIRSRNCGNRPRSQNWNCRARSGRFRKRSSR